MKQTIFDFAQEVGRPELGALARRILDGGAGVDIVDGWHTPDRQWVFYAPIRSASWSFVCRIPERVVLKEVRQRMFFGASALGTTLLLIVGCIAFVARLITRPITRLNAKVLEIAEGDLDVRVDNVVSSDEIGQLASSFNQMTADLRSHVQRLANEQAAREKIEHDLDIARDIQHSLLPSKIPDLSGFEVAGWSQPAEKTGGDYYDWQSLPDGKTAISLADATGHGIGPALVTVVCRAYARASFMTGEALGQLLNRINELLVQDLSAGRFVTFAVALLDPDSGDIELLSAGHGPILVYSAAEQTVREVSTHGVPLGILADSDYGSPTTIHLQPGDSLLLLTDGLFEWANPEGELFGLDRLYEAIRRVGELSPSEMIQSLHETVTRFVDGTSQDDDVTMIIVKRVAE